MKEAIKKMLAFAAPSLLREIKRLNRARFDKWHRAQVRRVVAAVTRDSGFTVRAGPFQGMKYVEHADWVGFVPKLLGIYERELAAHIGNFLAARYDVVVNIGSAEGYYAVGFARGSPTSKVIAYDIDPAAQALCSQMAQINGVGARVAIAGECTHATLRQDLAGRALVICDCEGAELQLLDPDAVPALKDADVLLELHEFVIPRLTQALLSRFRATHDIELVPAVAAGPELAAGMESMSLSDRRYAVSEFRPEGMEWAVITVRKG